VVKTYTYTGHQSIWCATDIAVFGSKISCVWLVFNTVISLSLVWQCPDAMSRCLYTQQPSQPITENDTHLQVTWYQLFHTQVVLVYLEWFRCNSLFKCVSQPKIAKNSLKPPILGVQGRSRSSVFVPPESPSAVLVMISSKSLSICNRFHAWQANTGKITISKWGTPLRCPRWGWTSSPSSTKLPHKKLETLGYHVVETRSLYLTWPWIGTGSWQTDRHNSHS